MWVVAGIGAFAAARLIRAGRPRRWLIEAALSLIAAVAAGLAATALDFGGWEEPDWRAGVFAFAVALGAIGLARAIGLVRR
jgi:hypothetical protein